VSGAIPLENLEERFYSIAGAAGRADLAALASTGGRELTRRPEPDLKSQLARSVDSGFRLLWKGSVMTHVCCPSCRLRFAPGAAACLVACPECAEPLQPIASLELSLGYRLVRFDELFDPLPAAVAVSMPVPDLPGRTL